MKSSEKWTNEKLQALTSMELEDPESWPESLRHRWHCNQRLVGLDPSDANLPLIRQCTLREAISRRLADQRAYLDLVFDALWSLAEPDSIEAKLLRALDDSTYWSDSIKVCMELLPKLDALLPATSVPEILEALGAPRPDGVPESYDVWLQRFRDGS